MKCVLYLGCPSAERPGHEKVLAAANLSVVWADTVSHTLSELERRDMPVLLDLSRGAAALQVAREIRSDRASTLIFAVVDARRADLATEAVLVGMADVFTRPLCGWHLASAIQRELGHGSRQTERPTPAALYSYSPAMRDVLRVISRASTLRAGVLIRGEEGTGRRVAARTIHDTASGEGPFVDTDCAAYEADEIDVELFGAAARARNGDPPSRRLERISRQSRLFEAQCGTLYLRNVAEAPTHVQTRLARVLRDREAVLVETGATVALDVRPMAGVDFAFDNAVREGRVREDLFRRLSVIRIDMPPLRNRREDIPALTNYFLREICASLRLLPKSLSRPALSLLSALPWHHNAVELRSLLESIVKGLRGGCSIGLEDVLAHVQPAGGPVVLAKAGTLRQARVRFEREYITAVLEQHRGRISDAAKALGIQRTNLYRKIRALGVTRDRWDIVRS